MSRPLATLLVAVVAGALVFQQHTALKKTNADKALLERKLALATEENDRLRNIVTVSEKAKKQVFNREQSTEIEQEVAKTRKLAFLKPVTYDVVTREEIRDLLSNKLNDVFSEEEFSDMGIALGKIGLLPPHFPLRQSYIDLLSEQIAAFYDQHSHRLFMFENASLENAQNRLILSHELTHALQDQHFVLSTLPLEIKTNDDKAAAASALVEGDATLVMADYMLHHFSLKALKENIISSLGQNSAQLEKAPPYLREMLIFPYLRGQEFCATLFARGGYDAISKAYAQPPTSTAQILHPEKYLMEPREEPRPVVWPSTAFKGAPASVDNVIGEFGIRILLRDGNSSLDAEQVASGWRGDRYLYFAKEEAIVWKTIWRDAASADAFFQAERKGIEARASAKSPPKAISPTPPATSTPPGNGPADKDKELSVYTMTSGENRSVRLFRGQGNTVIFIDSADAESTAALAAEFGK